jgi:hypothetical protein
MKPLRVPFAKKDIGRAITYRICDNEYNIGMPRHRYYGIVKSRHEVVWLKTDNSMLIGKMPWRQIMFAWDSKQKSSELLPEGYYFIE